MGGHHKLHTTHLQVGIVVNMDHCGQSTIVTEIPKCLLLELIVTQPSLILIGTGASLMGFYRLQMLEVLNLYFFSVKDFF